MSQAPSVAPAGANLWLHLVTLASIAIVGVTAGVMLVHEFGFDPPAAVAIGCCLFLIGSSGHLVVNKVTSDGAAQPKARRPIRDNAHRTRAQKTSAAVELSTDRADLDPDLVASVSDTSTPVLASFNDAEAQLETQLAEGDEPTQWANELAAGLAQSDPAVFAPPRPAHSEPQLAESEFERVERLVKRLADNVNQVEANRINAHSSDAATPTFNEPLQYSMFPHSNESDRQLANSIHALRATTGLGPTAVLSPPTLPNISPPISSLPSERQAIEHPALSIPSQLGFPPLLADAPRPLPPAPPVVAHPPPAYQNIQSGLELGAILEALAAHRIDVALEPILDLTAQRPEHYEVSIALRDQNAQLINLADIASDLSGTGALPLIDSARLVQAAQMARRLADKGRRGTVLAELNAESLSDANFETATRSEVGAFDGQIVLTLPQAQAHGFTYADWATLARLRTSGLAFALSDVTTLDMDFASLANAGFVFAKLDAQTFLSGLPIETSIVPPTDICRYLAQSGLTVIVQGIVASDQLAQVHACGVHLGQGQVFGGARQMKTAGAPPAQVAAE